MSTATVSKSAPDTSASNEVQTEASAPDVTAPAPLLSVEQVALRLQVKSITVLRLIWGKKLEACKVGSLWRIRPDAVEKFLRDSEQNRQQWPYATA